MPRVVDHQARRQAVVLAAWDLLARDGLQGLTMRELAAAAGYANGGLSPYFRSKEEVLLAAYEHAFRATNERADRARAGSSGLEALRVLCLEVMPLDEERRKEARVVLAFWDLAAVEPAFAEVYRTRTALWRDQLLADLEAAAAAGQVRRGLDVDVVADDLLVWLTGLQATATLSAPPLEPSRQVALLDARLHALTP